MDLWSKGLGRLVLRMRLSERSEMDAEGADLVLKGTMGKPTFWDWSVNLSDRDVVDFLVLLKRPDVVRYLVEDPGRWTLVRTAARGAWVFARETVRLFLLGPAKPAQQDSTTTLSSAPPSEAASTVLEEKS
jgi:hypothetical protein